MPSVARPTRFIPPQREFDNAAHPRDGGGAVPIGSFPVSIPSVDKATNKPDVYIDSKLDDARANAQCTAKLRLTT
jgi:hypothetical protein